MKMIQELGFAIAILFIVIGYTAKKHEYKFVAIICYIIAAVSFFLFMLAFVYIIR